MHAGVALAWTWMVGGVLGMHHPAADSPFLQVGCGTCGCLLCAAPPCTKQVTAGLSQPCLSMQAMTGIYRSAAGNFQTVGQIAACYASL